MKKWLLLLAFPIQLDAQNLLKPGLYRDLKPDKPIILDTGSYTFISLDMKNLGKGVWLDGRKAKSLTLQGCRFEGRGSESILPIFSWLLAGTPTLSWKSLWLRNSCSAA